MRQDLVEKLTAPFVMCVLSGLILSGPSAYSASRKVTPTRSCASVFASPEAVTPASHTVLTDHRVIDAAFSERRLLQTSEVMDYAQQLFVANIELFAGLYGFDAKHALPELRAYKAMHEKLDARFPQYKAMLTVRYGDQDHDVLVRFRSNGDTAFLVAGSAHPSASLDLRGVAHVDGGKSKVVFHHNQLAADLTPAAALDTSVVSMPFGLDIEVAASSLTNR